MVQTIITQEQLQEKYQRTLKHCNERQKRLLLASDARMIGYGGISMVSRASGISRTTIIKGIRDLSQSPVTTERIRREGGGTKKITERYPNLLSTLTSLIEDTTRGDPESPLKWTSKSTYKLADALKTRGYTVSHDAVGKLLKDVLGYRLQANRKTDEGSKHPDRDAQFAYINRKARQAIEQRIPVVSVDTKKKELVGRYKNAGREWKVTKQPEKVNVYDFVDKRIGKAVPYGVYDVGRNEAVVNVGTNYDTAEFAVESIRKWWYTIGRKRYDRTTEIVITADCGGSNGYRVRLWKWELQRLANEIDKTITVHHFPPGTSKWNKIEHRLFCHITLNWRGKPLVSYETIVSLIGATSTKQGLHVYAILDMLQYVKKRRITNEQMKQLQIQLHTFHGEWNYSILPRRL